MPVSPPVIKTTRLLMGVIPSRYGWRARATAGQVGKMRQTFRLACSWVLLASMKKTL
jgi:hypothetical protein